MKLNFRYDRVLRDLFQQDHPSLLEQLTGGVQVKEFLNVEFPKVMERRADLVALLEDGSLFHLEIQGQNDSQIAYREAFYCLAIAQKYKRPVRQAVIYVGEAKMRMPAELSAGGMRFAFQLLDIREIDSETLLRSGSPGDLALALLAKGGTAQLAAISRKAGTLSEHARSRLITQLAVLAGLRKLSGKLRMEMKHMGSVYVDFEKNEILRDVIHKVLDRGKAEGRAEGEARGEARGEALGMQKVLREMLLAKFGRIPAWADRRLKQATPDQLSQWSKLLLKANTLQEVLGPK